MCATPDLGDASPVTYTSSGHENATQRTGHATRLPTAVPAVTQGPAAARPVYSSSAGGAAFAFASASSSACLVAIRLSLASHSAILCM